METAVTIAPPRAKNDTAVSVIEQHDDTPVTAKAPAPALTPMMSGDASGFRSTGLEGGARGPERETGK